jgi:hypothetical protein
MWDGRPAGEVLPVLVAGDGARMEAAAHHEAPGPLDDVAALRELVGVRPLDVGVDRTDSGAGPSRSRESRRMEPAGFSLREPGTNVLNPSEIRD